ncbi:hypothetical protein AKJ09_11094 [Labilithrix luteola]|uniref:Uncharacterized protein n=1 Tax=Labilithrix luteola TaxID=1391654 RepID=A0A0K1QF80_9BACT|nr:hypothetical protein AKJ09_11094 [Labilithrix luteola]
MDGLVSDALGDRGAAGEASTRRRCDEVLRAIGDSSDTGYAQLRAVDAGTVKRLTERVSVTAATENVPGLAIMLSRIADTSRETLHARRAADVVKQVSESFPAEGQRANKEAAAPDLQSAAALQALLAYRGPFEADAHAIAILNVLERVESARGLPKHLKVYAVRGPFSAVFGISAPQLSDDAALPIPTGTWLAYLTRVAANAGHPVPPDARDPQNREPLAWNGILVGLADRLRNAPVDPSLAKVTSSVVARIDQQAASERAAFEAHAPEDR